MIEVPDDDPLRRYTPEEQRLLTEQLLAVTTALHAGELRGRDLNLAFLREHLVVKLGLRPVAVEASSRSTPRR